MLNSKQKIVEFYNKKVENQRFEAMIPGKRGEKGVDGARETEGKLTGKRKSAHFSRKKQNKCRFYLLILKFPHTASFFILKSIANCGKLEH